MPRRCLPLVLAALGPGLACTGGGRDGSPAAAPVPTYRAIAGVSMGAMGAAFLGARHPDRFDAIGALGGPLDAAFFLRKLDRMYLGGFCPLADLEAVVAAGGSLDDATALPCMSTVRPETGTSIPAHEGSFSAWPFTANGGTFDRNAYGDLFVDLSLAFGSLVAENPAAPPLPPGIPAGDLAAPPACGTPRVVPGLFDARQNPAGAHPAISFCDGEEPVPVCRDTGRAVDLCADPDPAAACAAEGGVVQASSSRFPDAWRMAMGRYDACQPHTRPLPVLLAVDVNGDGIRQLGEPVLDQGAEPFDDVGGDGCPDEREDGHGGCLAAPDPAAGPDPNGDNFDWRDHPPGTEGNWIHDEGEPFADAGLDGVAGTGDFGEGNGRYDLASGRKNLFAHDLRSLWPTWPEADRRRVSVYADGGIRDVFDFGVSAAHALAGIRAAAPDEFAIVEDPRTLPGVGPAFDPLDVDWSRVPRNVLHLYGDPAATPAEIAAGDGDHVGAPAQALARFRLFFGWLSARWAALPDPPGDGSPLAGRVRPGTFRSEALGGVDRDYVAVVPPGYDAPENAGARYPVVYFGHGYGMAPADLVSSHFLIDGPMNEGRIRKMIVVYPSGRCCFRDAAGARVCTEADASGRPNDAVPGLARECRRGTFYVDRRGLGDGDGTAYEASFFELSAHVDATLRTLSR
jgi:hypothetical protein